MNRCVCAQLGSREKYAIPRALDRIGLLDALITDLWVKPNALLSYIPRARSRYHPDLSNANIKSFTRGVLTHSVLDNFVGGKTSDQFFDNLVSRSLEGFSKQGALSFFSYSYSSRASMKRARSLGLQTFLGQINPGPVEAEIVVNEFKSYKHGRFKPTVPTQQYWEHWREETENAHRIIVNSEWSRKLLAGQVDAEKIIVVPLAYDSGTVVRSRTFPSSFSATRPLKLLYLGAVSLRKGFHHLSEAMRSMLKLPVRLDIVGGLKGPKELLEELPANCVYHGIARQEQVGEFYRDADALMFPTLSDGFGLVLLEAQSQALPVICSANCADVVKDGANGLVLPSVNPVSISESVRSILDEPELLKTYSSNVIAPDKYGIDALSRHLKSIS